MRTSPNRSICPWRGLDMGQSACYKLYIVTCKSLDLASTRRYALSLLSLAPILLSSMPKLVTNGVQRHLRHEYTPRELFEHLEGHGPTKAWRWEGKFEPIGNVGFAKIWSRSAMMSHLDWNDVTKSISNYKEYVNVINRWAIKEMKNVKNRMGGHIHIYLTLKRGLTR